jgi:hypothetical protein
MVLAVLLPFFIMRGMGMLVRLLTTLGPYVRAAVCRFRNVIPPSVLNVSGAVWVALALFGAATAWFTIDGWTKHELAAARHVLDARFFELTISGLMPGSALACLGAGAGDSVEASCEQALFATPQATAAAVAFVAAQLALLADGAGFARRDPSYAETLAHLRRALEKDRFGLVAHVLAARDGCTVEQCRAFGLLNNTGRIRANLVERSYDFYVVRHASRWPPTVRAPAGNAAALGGEGAPPPVPPAHNAQGNQAL